MKKGRLINYERDRYIYVMRSLLLIGKYDKNIHSVLKCISGPNNFVRKLYTPILNMILNIYFW